MLFRRTLLPALLLPPALARAERAPAALVERFHAALIAAMRDAAALGVRGRERVLRPVIEADFDLRAMARIAVGPGWTGLGAAQQGAIETAFADWTIATYAARFDGYAGERFETLGTTALGNGDRLVRTRLVRAPEEPVALSYLLRGPAEGPRIVDIYLAGTISELASRRSEFAAILRDGGPERLVADLDARTAAMLR